MEKIWKTVPGYSRYKASTDGEIYTPSWKGGRSGKIISPAKDAGGYMRTMLVNDEGRTATIKVHRIIATTFLENPEAKETVNHINGIKHDNRVENLEWATRSENVKHSFRTGLQSNKGSKGPTSILTESQVLQIREMFKPGVCGRKYLGEMFKVSPATIKDVILRKTWNHI